MQCPNCGTELKETERFCKNCGTSRHKEEPREYKNDGSFQRRGIKKFVKKRIKPLIGANAIIISTSLLLIILPYIFENNMGNHNFIVFPIFLLLSSLIFVFGTIGIFGASLDVSRGQKLKVIDVFKRPFRTSHKIILAILCVLEKMLYIVVLIIPLISIPFVFKTILLTIIIYCVPIIIIIIIMFLDDNIPKERKQVFSVISSAFYLTGENKVEFYAMIFSFGGWILLEFGFMGLFLFSLVNLSQIGILVSLLIISVLYIFYIPYLFGSIANLYCTWTEEESFEGQKGLSNNLVVFIGSAIVIIIVLGTSMLTSWFPKADFGNQILDYMQYDINATEFEIGNEESTIIIDIPKGYKLEKLRNENEATLDGEYDYINYWYSGYLTAEEQYKKDMEDEKNREKEACTYNYEEFYLTVDNRNIKVYSATEYCNENISNKYSYSVKMYYPLDNNNTLKVSLDSFEKPISKDNLQKFINIK